MKSSLLPAFTSRKLHLFASNIILMVLTNDNRYQNFDDKQNSFLGNQRSFFREFNAECNSIFLFLALDIVFFCDTQFCEWTLNIVSKLSTKIAIYVPVAKERFEVVYCNLKNFNFL